MSAFVYGRISRDQTRSSAGIFADDDKAKLVKAIAALIPADIILLHSILLSVTTTGGDGGSTVITDEPLLRAGFIILPVVSLLLFAIGRGSVDVTWVTTAKALLPVAAFVAWCGLSGTTALTPWVTGWSHGALTFGAAIIGVVVVAVNLKLPASDK